MSDSHMNDEKLIDDSEAQRRFDLYKSRDPFPTIAPALLNSADIHDYVIATGMISPYDPSRLKSASYEIEFNEGDLILWHQDTNNKEIRTLANDAAFYELEKNSIAFINLKTKFRLPDYIALRFNLQIQLVHSGLLLGTGPLVDPGFVGNLLIPVHNLTANKYRFKGTDGFIWVEFTKVSPNALWKGTPGLERHGQFKPFPTRKINMTEEYYFKRANNNNPIQSSIPGEVKEAKEIASGAQKVASDTKNYLDTLKKVGWISLLAIFVSAAIALIPIYSLVNDSVNYVKNAREEIRNELVELKALKKELRDRIDKEKKSGQTAQQDASPKQGAQVPPRDADADTTHRHPSNVKNR
jgi:deoxycytidine triphosphate deaminase